METPTQVFSCETFKNIYFEEHLRTTASKNSTLKKNPFIYFFHEIMTLWLLFFHEIMTSWLLLLTFEALKFLLSFCAIHLTISRRQTFNFDTCLLNFIYTCHFCFIKWIIVFATLFYKNIITFLLFVNFLLLNC